VVLTRPEGRNGRLADRLRTLGHEVVVCPLIALEPLGGEPIDVSTYDWVLLTSPTGATELRRRAAGRPRRVAAIGRATANAWKDLVDLVPAVSTQEGLLTELPRPAGRVLFAGAEGARPLLADELEADVVHLYRTRLLSPPRFPDGDLVVLASASAARAFAELRVSKPTVSIGPETTAAARTVGIDVRWEARTHDLEGLVAAVVDASRSA
jgi:uroporphyrinogen-III synthase